MAYPTNTLPHWPYPHFIAHRGAGKLAPENTLAAFRVGAQHGYRMFECDVKLSQDGVPFLLHDDTLARTTGSLLTPPSKSAVAGEHAWSLLSKLDAGSWYSPAFAGEPLPTLAGIAAFCIANGYYLNIEIKPSPGASHHTGEVVAEHAAHLWQGQAVQPLMTSFDVEALQGAKATQPELPRGLLLDTLWSGWFNAAISLGCVAVVCHYPLWTAANVAQVHGAGMRALSYTVNQATSVRHLQELGTDGIITDRIDLFAPSN
jgi:glycerophosphoryl diester phosphodiesterase